MMIHSDDSRRKSALWRSVDGGRAAKKKSKDSVLSSPLFGPYTGSPVEKKRGGILNSGLFSSKRRNSNPTPLSLNAKRAAQPSAEAIARACDILQSIFPKWERGPLYMILDANGYIMEETITAILNMEEEEEESKVRREQENGFSLQFPVKHPLPDDFLRLPSDDDDDSVAGDSRMDEERDDEEEEGEDGVVEEASLDSGAGRASDLELEEKSAALHPPVDVGDDQSDKSSVLAEDDGTLYGKTFGPDGEDLQEDVVTPMLNTEAMLKNQKIVADSMNQKFLPPDLRTERASILETAQIDVIKRSKLNLTEAEKRIRHREPHLVFELLSKASEIYRSGIISSQELDTLRSMIVSKIQPTKMLIDTTMTMNKVISDHEWHLLLLKAKGIRQALSVRVVKNMTRPPTRSSSHVEYVFRVVDVESGVVWFTKKRFKELYKLHRKLCRLSDRISECHFPARRPPSRISANELAHDRAPVLEAFLRTVAALVTPPPMTFLHGCALKQLQQFLDVPHEGILLRNRTLPISRELRVFVYHTVNDTTSPEGKACAKFLAKLRQNGVDPGKNLLEEVGTILDGVQEYMLEHRFEEMRTHVERLMKFFSSADLAEETQGRRNSYVSNLFNDDDVLTSNDKLHQLISDAIRHELEENICVPLMSDLLAFLRMRVLQKERQFRQRVALLRGQPQSYFGIPVNKISVSSWRSVIEHIKEIDDAFLPQDKMRKLVATAHQIHSLHRTERRMCRQEQQQQRQEQSDPSSNDGTSPRSTTDEEDVLSGDDFLPIFIYVIVHANLSAPILTQVLLNRLCDPEQRRSESGYYLATYEAALHHILSDASFPET
ncbi:hypothetical protein PINS_up013514 [Pythium insidiosum]|nr:hypothetical protein PINS_up013514 [Pythium insidiosum]